MQRLGKPSIHEMQIFSNPRKLIPMKINECTVCKRNPKKYIGFGQVYWTSPYLINYVNVYLSQIIIQELNFEWAQTVKSITDLLEFFWYWCKKSMLENVWTKPRAHNSYFIPFYILFLRGSKVIKILQDMAFQVVALGQFIFSVRLEYWLCLKTPLYLIDEEQQ